MAQVACPSFVDRDAAQRGERRLVKFLEEKLPDGYFIIPNAEYPSSVDGVVQYWEYDCIVLAPHGIYNIENKDWRGELWGDDQEWHLNGVRRPNPLKTCQRKSRILKGVLADWDPALRNSVWIDTLVTLSNERQTKDGFSPSSKSYSRIFLLGDALVAHLTDPTRISKSPGCISHLTSKLMDCLVWGERTVPSGRQETAILEFAIKTVVHEESDALPFKEYVAETRGAVKKPKRVRVYRLDPPGLTDAEQRKRTYMIRNQSDALEKIGPHANIVPYESRIDEAAQQFFEITDWMPEASLREVWKNRELSFEEKQGIVFDVCSAMEAAHGAGVVHRAIRPENVFLCGRTARLANFAEAFFDEHLEAGYTIRRKVDETNATAYDAPELAEGDATAAADIWSFGVFVHELFVGTPPVRNFYELNALGGTLPDERLPSRGNAMLPRWVDEVVKRALAIDPAKRWGSAREIRDYVRGEISASVTPSATHGGAEPPREPEPGMLVTPDLCLGEMLGQGGYSKVFKAHHSLYDRDYAIKIYNESVSVRSARDEVNALMAVSHPNVVKIVYCGTTNGGRFYTLMELLEGRNLAEFAATGGRRMESEELYMLAEQILGALVSLQERPVPIFHRDVKPQNIVREEREGRVRFVLTDFNIAAVADADQDLVGTQPYLPPDLIDGGTKVNWDKSADPFALGVTLYELACKAYPWRNVRLPQPGTPPDDPRVFCPDIDESFAKFLLKAIGCRKDERFADAKEMLAALKAIQAGGPQVSEAAARGDTHPPVSDAASASLPKTSDFVDYLSSLYSQSRYGNKGTRCGAKVGPLDEVTYVPTRLDTALMPAILRGEYRLVVVTGNAGDGKTAFIRRVEAAAGNAARLAHANGAEFRIGGVRFESNYDGSQDEDETANDDVLREFFRPFAGRSAFASAPEGRIIAINEGKLADFLSHEPSLAHLAEVVDRLSAHEDERPPEGLIVVNLNRRSVTADVDGGGSIFRRQLKAMCDSRLWSGCATCECAKYCFIRHNVQTFSDVASGEEAAGRLEWLLRMALYRRELHVTIRDARSFVAFLIASDCRCADIRKLYHAAGTSPEKYWRHLYFNAVGGDGEPSEDRLVKLVREADVANVAMPGIDRDLYFNLHDGAKFMKFPSRQFDSIAEFNRCKRENEVRGADEKTLRKLKERHRMQIRHHYFEGDFAAYGARSGFFARLPYRGLKDFRAIVSEKSAEKLVEAKKALARAVSLSEGCLAREMSDSHLVIASSRVSDPRARTYRRFPLDGFELEAERTEEMCLEREPSGIVFRMKSDPAVRLTVTLDLYEMLHYIARGFSPSVNDLQGHFLELEVFKTLLGNKPYSEVLVTRNDRDFHVVEMDAATAKITIRPLGEVQ